MNILDLHAPGPGTNARSQELTHIEGLKCNFNFVRKSGNQFGVRRVQKHTQLGDAQLFSYFQSPYFLLLST